MSNLEIIKTYGLFASPFNKKLISELKKKGENCLIFPLIETEKLEITETAAHHLRNLTDFDWIIFTDVFAADYFIEALRELETDFFELDNLTVCAIGEAVADRLRFVQVHADVIPSKIKDEAVFSEISQFVGGVFDGLRFLIVTEQSADLALIEKLKAEQAIVEELPLYKADFQDRSEIIKLKTLLTSGAVDEFIFSSPDDLASLKFLTSEADLASLLNETRVSAVSEIVYQSLQENDFRPLYFHHK
ncbi:MAG TPA: uroporphyrinogen-III synthase [Pyrinomonadaceae bacterium]|nr:uroporphyrinogen-III synthase [Pyrinomonadaceae bacterium]